MNHLSVHGLVDYALKHGGSIHPLIIPECMTGGTGLMNPSVFVDGENILVNVRHVNYTFYHSEYNELPHQWGPLLYIHPEDDVTLRTDNIICHLNSDMEVTNYYPVKMTYDRPPVWKFIGLEDARLFRWNNRLFMCGVRRDHIDDKGTARMDLSEIVFDGACQYTEMNRTTIPAPGNDDTYCEKNWMPILDRPFEYVKWNNPVEIAKFVPEEKRTESTIIPHEKPFRRDLRGSSHVVPYKDHYIGITHETVLHLDRLNRKDGRYCHRLIVWDKDFNLINYSEEFTFMRGEVEFACGMALYGDDVLITFGFQDNAAFLLRMPQFILERMLVE